MAVTEVLKSGLPTKSPPILNGRNNPFKQHDNWQREAMTTSLLHERIMPLSTPPPLCYSVKDWN